MSEFLNMGGYALYVWSAFGITLTVLIVNAVLPMRREKQLLQGLKKRQQCEEAAK